MPTKTKGRAIKRTLLLKLEGADCVAFSKACEAAETHGITANRRPARFAAWLLERAASAYVTAPSNERDRFWKFVLQLGDFEESAASQIIFRLNRGDEFEQLKMKR